MGVIGSVRGERTLGNGHFERASYYVNDDGTVIAVGRRIVHRVILPTCIIETPETGPAPSPRLVGTVQVDGSRAHLRCYQLDRSVLRPLDKI